MNKNIEVIKCPNCGYSITDLFNQELFKAKEKLEREANLRISERNQLIESLSTQLAALQRKIQHNSVSQQAAGEALELMLQEFLTRIYPLDQIKEVPKGKFGADCIQIINTRERKSVGSILYECKRTKSWSPKWIAKFKLDLKESKCTFGVLVSQVLPNEYPRMNRINGIWVCTPDDLKILSMVLREATILSDLAVIRGDQKDTAEKLFAYITSPQFQVEIEAVLEGFAALDDELNKEKRSMAISWKNREAAIRNAIQSTITLYTSFRTLTGLAIAPLEDIQLKSGKNLPA